MEQIRRILDSLDRILDELDTDDLLRVVAYAARLRDQAKA